MSKLEEIERIDLPNGRGHRIVGVDTTGGLYVCFQQANEPGEASVHHRFGLDEALRLAREVLACNERVVTSSRTLDVLAAALLSIDFTEPPATTLELAAGPL